MIGSITSTSSLARQWQSAGLERGDIALIHASSKRTLKERGITPADLLESFVDAVGPKGTLLFPTFNFGWCRSRGFDIRETPSEMGVLSETARTSGAACRSGHPVYSFAAIGPRPEYWSRDGGANWSGYGYDSPFHWLRAIDGKIAILDLPDQNSMTFYHHVEEMIAEHGNLPRAAWFSRTYPSHRRYKHFDGRYCGYDGRKVQRSFVLYVRRPRVETHVDPMGELLWERGRYSGDRPKSGGGLRVVRARDVFDDTAEVLRAGKAEGMLYRRRMNDR